MSSHPARPKRGKARKRPNESAARYRPRHADAAERGGRVGGGRVIATPELRELSAEPVRVLIAPPDAKGRRSKALPSQAAPSESSEAQLRAAPPPNTRAFALQVKTTTTPRPEIAVPNISVANVDWEDATEAHALSPLSNWARVTRELERRLRDLSASDLRPSFDPREGRLLFRTPDGAIAAEARDQVLCTLAQPSLVMTMGWADPVLTGISVPPIAQHADEVCFGNDDAARETAARAAAACGAEFVVRLPAPQVDYFVALRNLRPGAAQVTSPGTPVAFVLQALQGLRAALTSRSETTGVLRASVALASRALQERADTEYRETEWVTRLMRSARVIANLGARLSPPTFTAIAAGRTADDFVTSETARDLLAALKLVEDEWSVFA